MNPAKPVKVNPQKTALAREHKHNRPLTACHWEPKSRFIFFGAEDNLAHRFELAVHGGRLVAFTFATFAVVVKDLRYI